MISRIHSKLGTAGFIISIVALVAALGGGAYAASSHLTGKQKKEVTKIAQKEAKKYAGKPGAPGANGPAGSKGDAGAAGAAGTNGTNGTPGTPGSNGVSPVGTAFSGSKTIPGTTCHEGGVEYKGASTNLVCNGEEGSPGPEGVCATSACHLPSGVTETGTFYIKGETKENQQVPIGWSIPLSTSQAAYFHEQIAQGLGQPIHWVKPGEDGGTCNGSPDHPTTENPGELCFYIANGEASLLNFPPPVTNEIGSAASALKQGVSTGGTLASSEEFTWSGWIEGSFALTAP